MIYCISDWAGASGWRITRGSPEGPTASDSRPRIDDTAIEITTMKITTSTSVAPRVGACRRDTVRRDALRSGAPHIAAFGLDPYSELRAVAGGGRDRDCARGRGPAERVEGELRGRARQHDPPRRA